MERDAAIELDRMLGYHGLGQLEPDAIYILFARDDAVVLGDVAALTRHLDRLYRRVLALALDPALRNIPDRVLQLATDRHDVEKTWRRALDQRAQVLIQTSLARAFGRDRVTRERRPLMIGRIRISSPGFAELLGNPQVFVALIALLGVLVVKREQSKEQAVVLAQKDRELELKRKEIVIANAKALAELGFAAEDIATVADLLDRDMGLVLQTLARSSAGLVRAEGSEIIGILPPSP